VQLSVDDLGDQVFGQPGKILAGGAAVERRDARHDGHCTHFGSGYVETAFACLCARER
jgi:hypothetical protein